MLEIMGQTRLKIAGQPARGARHGVLAVALLLTTGACGARDEGAGPTQDEGQVLASTLQRSTSPEVAPSDAAALSAGNTDFAFALYRALRARSGNLFFSPHSISTALVMLYAGARGATAEQIAQVLHFTLPPDRLHPAFNALDLALGGGGARAATDPAKRGFQLNVANALWGQRGFSILPEYLDTLALHYGAGVRVVDFEGAPEAAREAINHWGAKATENMIPEALPRGSVSPETLLMLANAIYFKADWAVPFAPAQTKEGDFHLGDGTTTRVPMMSQVASHRYARGSGYQAAELAYKGLEVSMLVVVPDQGAFAAVEQALDGATIASLDEQLRGVELALELPKYKLEFEVKLTELLSDLGMPSVFKPGEADLSGINSEVPLTVQQIRHKAVVEVDEQGTKAAAITVVGVGTTSVPERVSLKIDRPFIFLIRHRATGALLFVGRALNPAG